MKSRLAYLVPVLAAALIAGFNLIGLRSTEWRVYDLFLRLKPAIAENESILILAVDDPTINNVGTYPLPRIHMADGLLLLREFGAKYTTFDVEFVDKSPRGIDAEFLSDELPQTFRHTFSDLEENIVALFGALRDGRIALEDADPYVDDLTSFSADQMRALLDEVSKVERDNDQYLGQVVRYFGNAFLTVNMLDWHDSNTSDEIRQFAIGNLAMERLRVADDSRLRSAVDIRPAILPIIRHAKGAGFPLVVVDPDGVQRRVDLIYEYEGSYFPQLGLAPLLDWLGSPEVEVQANRIVIREANHPVKGVVDIEIPVTSDGHLLINWPKKLFEESFSQLSYFPLVYHTELEADLYNNMQIMEDQGYLTFYEGSFPLLDLYHEVEFLKTEMLESGDTSMMGEFREYRQYFFDELGAFLQSAAEEQILREYQRLLESESYSESDRQNIRDLMTYVTEVFAATDDVYERLIDVRSQLADKIRDRFVIIGYVGTSTTDIGVNPFQEEYMNVGTHAAVVNTILQGKFLDNAPWWVALLIGFAFSIIASVFVQRLKPVASLLVGAGFVLVVAIGLFGVFLITGVYINTLSPTITVLLTVAAISVLKFVRTEQEKGYIRNAFSRYLSDDVILDLLSDPGKLNLGGEKKRLTAVFTDVMGFSTIAEQLDPQDLVELLNQYLTEMSDVVLKQRGTIDKYEGDAIICFFGAPVQYEDHAERACYTAVKMKSLEIELNKRILAEGRSPTPLLTRIGINTGDIVVGNMGTEKKMDYTMMGSAVNVAARLEGVNKQYGTWILITEPTYRECGANYVTRKLDRVRVVGIREPIRLYELIDKVEYAPKVKFDTMELFSSAIDLFEDRKWDRAKKNFEEVLQIDPEDMPSKVYVKRCEHLEANPPSDDWDGIFNLEVK